jgi:hypothetical protein
MKLIRTDGTVTEDRPLFVTPIPQEIRNGIRRKIEADGPRIMEMNRRNHAGAAILGPAPVGGEDAYFAALQR